MGQIVTFYSYKGGVGRTMALANVAVLLSQYGYKILVVDWDLEAPGLEFFFKNYFTTLSLDEVLKKKGIVDILNDVLEGKLESSDIPKLDNLLVKIVFPEGREVVHFLTAGRRDESYYAKLGNLNLDTLYAERKGGDFIEELRDIWKRRYDFVLIDSRTGVTDIGGVCTIQLPDILLLIFTATEQNLRGTIDIAQRTINARQKLPFDRLSLIAVPIPGRFDTTVELEAAQEWLTRFDASLSGIFGNWLPTSIKVRDFFESTKIPYVPYFSFGEELAVLKQGTRDPSGLGYAFETLAALIANKVESVELLRDDRSNFIRQAHAQGKNVFRILFLAANPKETSRIRLDQEVREVTEKLQLSGFRDRLEISTKWLARAADLSQVLLDIRPNIIHFTGHGNPSRFGEISLEDNLGRDRPVPVDALSTLFSTLTDLQCVILNSCYSKEQAKGIVQYVPYVIGTSPNMSDRAAMAFVTGFYQALAAGRTVDEAYQLGSAQIMLQGTPEDLNPILLKKEASEKSSGEYKPSVADFVIVTALEEESDAVLDKLSGYRRLPPSGQDIRTYYQAEIPVIFPDGTTGIYNVIAMPLLGMGRVQAVVATTDAIRRWRPRYVLQVGIAGGVASSNVRIGDILISDQIIDYELQKITPQGAQMRWEVHRADPRLLDAARNIFLAKEEWTGLINTPRPCSGTPGLHIGPIASGDKVIAFGDVLTRYRDVWPKVIGIEMEAAGVATAAFQSCEHPGFFMVRGVSDLADTNKNKDDVTKWRGYACDVAASYVVALLKSGPVPLSDKD
jgi:nucleoside phosphorylase/cellulose biosynthesis protein BcsQ